MALEEVRSFVLGTFDGMFDGMLDGMVNGMLDGMLDGMFDGMSDGMLDGVCDKKTHRCTDTPAHVGTQKRAPAHTSTAADCERPPALAVASPPSSQQPAYSQRQNVPEAQAPDARCVVCLERERTHAFAPCGHQCCCAGCADGILASTKACPLCRAPCAMVIKIFK